MAHHQPDAELAKRVLPAQLHAALAHVFAQGIRDRMLVGGTAIAGYYAGHRRSDDLDLFVRDAKAHRATVLAVGSTRTATARCGSISRSRAAFERRGKRGPST